MKGGLKSDLRLFWRSLALIQRCQPRLIPVGLLASVVAALHPLFNIYMASLLVDRLSDGYFPEMLRIALFAAGLNALIDLIKSGLNHLKTVQEHMFYAYQKQLTSNKIMELDYERAESVTTREKLRLLDDMHEITGMRLYGAARRLSQMAEKVVAMIASAFLLSGCFTAKNFHPANPFQSVMSSPWLAAALCAAIGLLLAATVILLLRQGVHHFRIYEDMLPFDKVKWYYDREYLDSYRTGKEIRIFDQSGIIGRDYNRALSGYNALCLKMGKDQGRFAGVQQILSLLCQCLIYLYVGLKALAGIFGVGSIVRYVGAIVQFYLGIEGIIVFTVSFQQLFRWLRVYWDFMDIKNVNYKGSLPVEKRSDNEYEIEFCDVSFQYPASGEYALKNVSLKFRIGQRLAVVGMNGSGKTTLIKLLCRLYDPTQGAITLNGIDIKKYDLSEYTGLFSVVFQDFKLFSFTLGQNVAASRVFDRKRAEDALNKSGFSERLRSMEGGLDAYLYNNFGEQGVELSGGEAQKIALARALYKDAPFIILDEPTAALDPIAEYEIYSKLDGIVGEKTAVYISHRLSSCRFCDDIAVFDQGHLIQRGSHEKLLEDESGKYYELWRAQAQYYQDAG